MVSGERQVVNDLRRSLRVKERLPVCWRVKNTNLSGEGRVLNLSTSGLLLETGNISPMEQSVFNLESLRSNGFALPREGRLVWSKAKSLGHKRLCGLEFIEPNEEVVSQLREKIQRGIIKGTTTRRWRSVIGTMLVIVMLILTVFALRQYAENYENTLLAQQIIIGAYEQQARLTQMYTEDLAMTRNQLVEAQAQLEQAKAEITQLSDRNSQYQQTIAQHQQAITQLEEKNVQLTQELAVVQERLRFLEGDVKSLQEAKAFIGEYKGKLRSVKTKIRAFNREAFEAKVAAQKEKDRIAMLLGNNGYLIKEGKPNKLDPAVLEKEHRIQIDVQIIK